MTETEKLIVGAQEKNQKRIETYDFTKAKVLISVPSSWDKWTQMNVSHFIYQQSKKPYFLDYVAMASRSPEMGRNQVIRQAMEKNPDWTHILFMDWDTWPMPETIGNATERLLALDKDIAAGMYPVWLDNLPFWTVVTQEQGTPPDADKMIDGTNSANFDTSFRIGHLVTDLFPGVEPMKVDRVGMGFAMVKRKVFENIEMPYMKQLYKPDGGILCTEDYYFCDKVRRAGMEIWLDPLLTCSHSQRRDTTQDIMVVMKIMIDKFSMQNAQDKEKVDQSLEEVKYVLKKMGQWDQFKKTYEELKRESVEKEPQSSAA